MQAAQLLNGKPQGFPAIRRGMPPDEGALVLRARELDPETWTDIYQRYYQRIYSYLYYRLGRTEVAEDLTSTVFIEALERIGSFEYRGLPLISWLYRIAHNLAVSYLRRQKASASEPLGEEVPWRGALPEEQAERAATAREVNQALQVLTEDQRQVVLLKFVSDMSNAEVAQIMRKPEGAVKSLQHRALDSLRRVLGGEESNDR